MHTKSVPLAFAWAYNCTLVLSNFWVVQSDCRVRGSFFSIFSTDHEVYSWPSAMQVHLSTWIMYKMRNILQASCFYYQHCEREIQDSCFHYQHYYISLSAQGTAFRRSCFTIMHTCTCAYARKTIARASAQNLERVSLDSLLVRSVLSNERATNYFRDGQMWPT